MEPITHLATGHAIGLLALEKAAGATPEAQAAYWAAVAGSVAPDIDWIIRYTRGKFAYLVQHRTVTHSLPVLSLIAVLSAVGVALLFPLLTGQPAPRPGVLFAWAMLGALAHIGLDVLNAYGTAVFWPLSRRRVAADILFMRDPQLLLLLAASALPAALGAPAPGVYAAAGLLLSGLYLALRAVARLRAIQLLKAHWRRHGKTPSSCSVLPAPLGIRRWRFVADYEEAWLCGTVTIGPGRPEIAETARFFRDSEPAAGASLEHPAVRRFVEFSRYPWHHTVHHQGGYHVYWSDLRFFMGHHAPPHLVAVLDTQLRPQRVTFLEAPDSGHAPAPARSG